QRPALDVFQREVRVGTGLKGNILEGDDVWGVGQFRLNLVEAYLFPLNPLVPVFLVEELEGPRFWVMCVRGLPDLSNRPHAEKVDQFPMRKAFGSGFPPFPDWPQVREELFKESGAAQVTASRRPLGRVEASAAGEVDQQGDQFLRLCVWKFRLSG